MSAVSETPVTERQILLAGPYGVLGTGVIDAVAENPKWGISTVARRPLRPTGRRPHRPTSASISWTARARRKPFHLLTR